VLHNKTLLSFSPSYGVVAAGHPDTTGDSKDTLKSRLAPFSVQFNHVRDRDFTVHSD
jgi:hypothetical protein